MATQVIGDRFALSVAAYHELIVTIIVEYLLAD